MNAETALIAVMCAAAFVAGLVDSVVGGGGLIQLPALLIGYPDLPATKLLGTNRISSIFGTSVAMLRYAREASIPWRTMLPTAAVAALGSLAGARVATLLNTATFKPMIVIVLIAVTIYTLIKKDFGKLHAPRLSENRQRLAAMLVAAPIGFYDGFLGPGTGSFLIFAFVGVLGFSFLAASAVGESSQCGDEFVVVDLVFADGQRATAIGVVHGGVQRFGVDGGDAPGAQIWERVCARVVFGGGAAGDRAAGVGHLGGLREGQRLNRHPEYIPCQRPRRRIPAVMASDKGASGGAERGRCSGCASSASTCGQSPLIVGHPQRIAV